MRQWPHASHRAAAQFLFVVPSVFRLLPVQIGKGCVVPMFESCSFMSFKMGWRPMTNAHSPPDHVSIQLVGWRQIFDTGNRPLNFHSANM